MRAVVEIWLESLIDNFTYDSCITLHCYDHYRHIPDDRCTHLIKTSQPTMFWSGVIGRRMWRDPSLNHDFIIMITIMMIVTIT